MPLFLPKYLFINKVYETNKEILIKNMSSEYKINGIIFIIKSKKSGHSILLTNGDKIIINGKKRKNKCLENTAKYNYGIDNERFYGLINNGYKEKELKCNIIIKDSIVSILIIYENMGIKNNPSDLFYFHILFFVKNNMMIKRIKEKKIRYDELKKELIEYYYHPSKMGILWDINS